MVILVQMFTAGSNSNQQNIIHIEDQISVIDETFKCT